MAIAVAEEEENNDDDGDAGKDEQLPDDNSSDSARRWKKIGMCLGCFFLLLVVIAGVIIMLFVLQRRSDITASDSTTTMAPTLSPIVGSTTPSPSSTPSSTPTLFPTWLLYDPPTQEDCERMAASLPVDGQETMELRLFSVEMDVELSSTQVAIEPQLLILEEQIQTLLLPRLAGCGTELSSTIDPLRFVIANGLVHVKLRDGVDCSAGRSDRCHAVEVFLDLFLWGDETYFTIMQIINEVFLADANKLKGILQLGADYIEVTVRTVSSYDPTASPTIQPAAMDPTRTPSFRPTPIPA